MKTEILSKPIVAQHEYGPFGELIRATGTMAAANPFWFSTRYRDCESALLYYGLRYYNPSTGRWLSRDPIGEKGGKNLYAFLGNAPCGEVDAYGNNATDLYRKLAGEQIPKAYGLNAGGAIVAKLPWLPGTVAVATLGHISFLTHAK